MRRHDLVIQVTDDEADLVRQIQIAHGAGDLDLTNLTQEMNRPLVWPPYSARATFLVNRELALTIRLTSL